MARKKWKFFPKSSKETSKILLKNGQSQPKIKTLLVFRSNSMEMFTRIKLKFLSRHKNKKLSQDLIHRNRSHHAFWTQIVGLNGVKKKTKCSFYFIKNLAIAGKSTKKIYITEVKKLSDIEFIMS